VSFTIRDVTSDTDHESGEGRDARSASGREPASYPQTTNPRREGGTALFSSTLKRPAATLAVVAGLLAAAVPAGAQGGGADFTRPVDDKPVGILITNGTADDQMSVIPWLWDNQV
jgi:hypothetical protein